MEHSRISRKSYWCIFLTLDSLLLVGDKGGVDKLEGELLICAILGEIVRCWAWGKGETDLWAGIGMGDTVLWVLLETVILWAAIAVGDIVLTAGTGLWSEEGATAMAPESSRRVISSLWELVMWGEWGGPEE